MGRGRGSLGFQRGEDDSGFEVALLLGHHGAEWGGALAADGHGVADVRTTLLLVAGEDELAEFAPGLQLVEDLVGGVGVTLPPSIRLLSALQGRGDWLLEMGRQYQSGHWWDPRFRW